MSSNTSKSNAKTKKKPAKKQNQRKTSTPPTNDAESKEDDELKKAEEAESETAEETPQENVSTDTPEDHTDTLTDDQVKRVKTDCTAMALRLKMITVDNNADESYTDQQKFNDKNEILCNDSKHYSFAELESLCNSEVFE